MKIENSVSVIIPMYNCESSVHFSIDSILEQTLSAYEIILVNDGSTDDTIAAIAKYGDSVIYTEQENLGPATARNKGIGLAKGEYIMFLDADDYVLPDFLEKTVDFLSSHPECVAVSTAQKIIRPEGQPESILPGFFSKNTFGDSPFVIDDFYSFWGEHDHILTGSVLMKSSAVNEVGSQLENLRVSEDLEFWAMLGTLGKWGFVPEVLWVGTSEMHAVKTGWTSHFKKRRSLCPLVEDWEVRLKKSIRPEDEAGFKVVRGRVALGFAFYHLLAGKTKLSRSILRNYSNELPKNKLSKVLAACSKFGFIGMWCASILFRTRDHLKDLNIIK